MSSSNHPSVVFLLGAVFLIAGIYFGYNQYRFVSVAQPAVGHVVDQIKYVLKKGKHVPIVQFRIASGRTMRFQVNDALQGPPFFIGQKIPVLYLVAPGHPTMVRKDSWLHLWGGPVLMIVVGIGLFALVLMAKPRIGQSD